jgi:hypothetical protein
VRRLRGLPGKEDDSTGIPSVTAGLQGRVRPVTDRCENDGISTDTVLCATESSRVSPGQGPCRGFTGDRRHGGVAVTVMRRIEILKKTLTAVSLWNLPGIEHVFDRSTRRFDKSVARA